MGMDDASRFRDPPENAEIVILKGQVEQLREAAEIFRDFGGFQHLHRPYELEQVTRAKMILRLDGH